MNFFDDVFWPEWPDKQNKKLARVRCEAALKRGAEPDKVMAGLRQYINNKPDWKAWMHATTFFNGDRWEDEHEDSNPFGERLTATQALERNGNVIAFKEES